MDSNFTSRPKRLGSEHTSGKHQVRLVLHNDEINTFEYVMETLVEAVSYTHLTLPTN